MSVAEMVNAAKGTGLKGRPLVMAIAVSLAENPTSNPVAVHHNTDGSSDYGYWQINSVHSQYDPRRLLREPAYNAKAMYEISHGGTDWSPWATYPAKAQSKLNDAEKLVNDKSLLDKAGEALIPGYGLLEDHLPDINVPNPVEGLTGAIAGPFKAFGSLTSHLLDSKFWLRIGQGLAAFALLALALALIFRKQIATGVITAVAPEAGAAVAASSSSGK